MKKNRHAKIVELIGNMIWRRRKNWRKNCGRMVMM